VEVEIMKTRTITQVVTFSASPREVFEALMDPAKHSKFTGLPAMIDRKPGGRFAYGEILRGNVLELKQDERIVLSWRENDWPQSYYSMVTCTLAPLADGRRTQLSLVHTGVPEDRFDEINEGWQIYYWTKMAAYFRDEKIAVVRRFVDEVKNKRSLDIIDELFAPDFVFHKPGTILPVGPAGPKEAVRALFAAFSKICVSVEETIVEGDRVVERDAVSAVHTGEFNGVPATGRQVCWTENNIYRIKDGKIAETWTETSLHDLIAQLTAKESKAA
jgi:predicted ester cyclase/uncharacterized protein YndB with AHSA1/START domain